MTNEAPRASGNLTRTKLWLDTLIFIAFLVTMDPRSSGIAVHEWLSLAMLGTIVVHLLLSWDWIAQISSRFLKSTGAQNRLNYIINWLLFINGTLLMISGIMISEVALPSLGITLPKQFTWRGLHDLSANLGLLILGIHTALHWGWILNTFRRYVGQPLTRLFSTANKKEA